MLNYTFDPKTRIATFKGYSIQVPEPVGTDADGLYIVQRGEKLYLPPSVAFAGSPSKVIGEDGNIILVNYGRFAQWPQYGVDGLQHRQREEKVGWFKKRTVTDAYYCGEQIDFHWEAVMRMAVMNAEQRREKSAANRGARYPKPGTEQGPGQGAAAGEADGDDESLMMTAMLTALLVADYEEGQVGRPATDGELEKMLDRAIARGASAPQDPEDRRVIAISARALTLDAEFLNRLRARQKSGRVGLDAEDFSEARRIVQRTVQEFQRATGG